MTLTLPLILFYLFAGVLVISSLVVISCRNMVIAILFLILAFINASALFVLLGAEFLAMLLIVVYVGAIAVMFLFVVMMLDIDLKITQEINRKRPIFILISAILFFEVLTLTRFSTVKFYETKTLYPINLEITNVESLGKVLYTDFILPFQIAGAILFVAMIGAIILTLKDEVRFIRKQQISQQIARNKANSLEIVKVKINSGINL
ncbi:MAG: NADH-quinone oxidoreductase subunit J [Alphaproteobacteria bacterium]